MEEFKQKNISEIKRSARYIECTIQDNVKVDQSCTHIIFESCQIGASSDDIIEFSDCHYTFIDCQFVSKISFLYDINSDYRFNIEGAQPSSLILELRLSGDAIPEWVRGLPVTELDIADYEETHSESLAETLIANKHCITDLSFTVGHNLSKKLIDVLPTLQALKTVEISGLTGDTPLKWLGALKSLQSLGLFYTCNVLDNDYVLELPDIPILDNIQSFTLSGSEIERLPEKCPFANLKKLFISGNKIKTIADTWLPDTLETLTISYEPIQVLPAKLTELPRLAKLGFHYLENNLQLLKFKAPRKLRSLTLESIGLKTLPITWIENCTSIKYLSVSSNQLTSIDGIEKIPSLEKLYAINNQIVKLPSWIFESEWSEKLEADFHQNPLDEESRLSAVRCGYVSPERVSETYKML